MMCVLVHDSFDYMFGENGLTAYKLGKQLPSQSFISFVGEERYKVLANFILHYIADLDIPIKRYVHSHSALHSPCECRRDVQHVVVARSSNSAME